MITRTIKARDIKLDELNAEYYLIKLTEHQSYSYPRIRKESLLGIIKKRGWLDKEIELTEADFPYLGRGGW